MAFSELEVELESLGTVDIMGWWNRVKWQQKESTLQRNIEKLVAHKISLNLILTVLLW
jgi:hypothetical protein